MKKIKIAVIGCGNITNLRHIPALLKNKQVELIGVVGNNQKRIDSTLSKYPQIKNSFLLDDSKELEAQYRSAQWFINEVEAVVIGTPPFDHNRSVSAVLNLGKHALVEKPMMMSLPECDEVISIANKKGLILNVNHSFQFADGITKLESIAKSGVLGEIRSIVEIQFTNRNRRLPVWYNELPLGLFYDEAAHFFYSAIRFGGELNVESSSIQSSSAGGNTPCHLSVQAKAGNTPVQMYMNFDAPVCEWHLHLMGTKKAAIYDFFKDILIIADNDELHLAGNVLKTSLQYTTQFWKGFIVNGFKMVTGKLLYGHDKVIESFIGAIETGKSNPLISAELGRQVVVAMNKVIEISK